MPVYDQDHDYTRDGSGEDFEIGAFAAPSVDADQIEQENGWRKIPPGEHTLVVQGFFLDDDEKVFPVMVGGRAESFASRKIRVRLALPHDPRAQISDTFFLPPADPAQQRAYLEGVAQNARQGDKGGFQAKKFFHFASRLGLVDPATNALTAVGRKPSQWKGRAIVATVEAGRGTYTNREGKEVPRDDQVKLFSYRPTGGVPGVLPGDAAEPRAHAGHAAGRQPAMAGRPANQRAAAGLDDL